MKKHQLFLTLLMSPFLALAQPNNLFLDKNNGDIKIINEFNTYNKVFDDDGEKKAIAKTTSIRSNLGIRFGLSEKINLLLEIPFLENHKVNGSVIGANQVNNKVNSKISGFGDLNFGIGYLLLNNAPWKVMVEFDQSIATSKNNQIIGLNTGFSDNHQQIKINLGYSRSANWYFSATTGFTNHNKGFGDEATGKLEFDIVTLKNLWLNFRIEGIQPFENGDQTIRPISNGKIISEGLFYGLYAQHRGYLMLSPEIRYEITKNLGLFASIKKCIKAQNFPSSEFYQFGLHYHLIPKDK